MSNQIICPCCLNQLEGEHCFFCDEVDCDEDSDSEATSDDGMVCWLDIFQDD